MSTLLNLPLELRLDIYALLLILPPISKEDDFHFRNCTRAQQMPPTPPSSPPNQYQLNGFAVPQSYNGPPRVHAAVLGVCRQVHREALPILYAQNTFVAHPSLLSSFPRLRSWYPPVRESSMHKHIRRWYLQVRLDCDVPFTATKASLAFDGAAALEIDLVQSVFLGVGYSNLRVLEQIRGVKRVKVGGSTTGFEKYIGWLEDKMVQDEDEEDDGEPFQPEEDDLVMRLSIFP
ncbi:hypothetical protein VHEMI01369 [[Torrubiella] hemipterigena]|uniref:DUF7730 domain-containing protein n=1 Tax=[Torrubiella] hemipterigena TaxID=1531966 RepID=A0A0A1T4K9_9HYPO|nr:hypothetical protein VHEMI01369 [[Torrubiella] hemipterigena]